MANLVLCLTRFFRCKGWSAGSAALTTVNSQPQGDSCSWLPSA